MRKRLVRRTLITCLVVVALAAVAVPIAKLATSTNGTLEACINPGNGMMRLVDSDTACHNNETRVEWNIEGVQGPPGLQGPPGPQGPPGESSGPPFVWICTPAYLPQSASNTRADLYVHNVSSSTANVSVNILNKDGTNLMGTAIPGMPSPGNYPGEANGATVAVSSNHTRIVNWMMPTSASDPANDVSVSVRVVSDQPVVVASHFQFNPIGIPNVCHQAK